ncbi:MAG: hypothetical protein P4M14_12175 [Gammaproteobacteria bacterium]|nr:hypothetical protein [Gammaproteobacteria bacterium]
MPTNEEELKASLGVAYWNLQNILHSKNSSSKANAIKALGMAFEDSHAIYQAALCYCIASTFNDLEAYTQLIRLIKQNHAAPNHGDPLVNDVPIQLCETKRETLKAKIASTSLSFSQKQSQTHPANIRFNMPIHEHFDADLKQLLVKTKSEMTLAQKLDLMYEILLKTTAILIHIQADLIQTEHIKAIRYSASQFIQAVLDIQEEEKIPALMMERLVNRRNNPEFIPGMKPNISPLPMSFLPEKSTDKTQASWQAISELVAAKHQRKFLQVTKEEKSAKKTTPDEHSYYRVIIKGGKFYYESSIESFHLFDTKHYKSHDKETFAAYTINTHGEISAFNYYGMYEANKPFNHASMVAGAPIFVAGEVQINNGIFKKLTAHHGHYQPNIINIYHTLHYFKEKGVDLSQAMIYFLEPIPAELGITNTLSSSEHNLPHTYKADELYTKLHEKITKDLEDEKIAEKIALVTEMTTVMVSKRKTELMNRISEICFEFPQLSRELHPLLQKAALIDAAELGAAKQISKLNLKFFPIFKNHAIKYIASLANISAKYRMTMLRENNRVLQNLLKKANNIDDDPNNQLQNSDLIKNYYLIAISENKKMNKQLKKHVTTLITNLVIDIKNCLKKPKIILGLFENDKNKSTLHYIIDNLNEVYNQIKKIDTNQLEAIIKLDDYFDDFISIVEQLKNAANEIGIEACVNSHFELTQLVRWWVEKLHHNAKFFTEAKESNSH